jgi:hypothetical protein
MTQPIRLTLIFGLLSGLSILPLAHFSTSLNGWAVASKFFVLINLVFYGFLLCYWSRTPVASIVFPLLLATGVALWPDSSSVFIAIALGVFSWIRSGICFKDLPVRIVFAESTTIICGAGYLLFWGAAAASVPVVSIWFFFLVQALYFYIVPDKVIEKRAAVLSDPFEHARLETERILKSCSKERA